MVIVTEPVDGADRLETAYCQVRILLTENNLTLIPIQSIMGAVHLVPYESPDNQSIVRRNVHLETGNMLYFRRNLNSFI